MGQLARGMARGGSVGGVAGALSGNAPNIHKWRGRGGRAGKRPDHHKVAGAGRGPPPFGVVRAGGGGGGARGGVFGGWSGRLAAWAASAEAPARAGPRLSSGRPAPQALPNSTS